MPNAKRRTELTALRELARFYGAQPSYIGLDGKRHYASADSLTAVIKALGAPLDRLDNAADLLLEERRQAWERRLEPVSIVWGARHGMVEYFPPADALDAPLATELTTEAGKVIRNTHDPAQLKTVRTVTLGGRELPVKAIPLPRLPFGYHTLRVESGGASAETMIVAAPIKAFEPADNGGLWGLFLPLYALHTKNSWGAGDLGDFERLVGWTQQSGGSVVATLPLLASFLDEPFEPSPYVPASRLFWNEFYIDMARIPELEHTPEARALGESGDVRQAIHALRATSTTDYRGVMELKARILHPLAQAFFTQQGHGEARWEQFQNFLRDHPQAADYAAFRAACRRQHGSWQTWPEPMKQGTLTPADYDEAVQRDYLYAQFIVQEQMDRLSDRARQGGPGLYLDLPLGVNSDSYDVWRERDSFAWGVSGGAPPDPFFSKGQDWGFAPLHPRRIRQRRYQYIIECLRRLMSQAGAVRIDHVMGLHRLFWVPYGMEATRGVYVSYPAEELHAILNVESHRFQSMIVGEDLGTVPGSVRRAMKRHNIHGMYVLQFSINPGGEPLVAPVAPGLVASINTHDMPSFAGFWQGRDIDDKVDLGLLSPEDEAAERAHRPVQRGELAEFLERQGLLAKKSGEAHAELPSQEMIRAAHEYLARSPAKIVLLNLEDLWQELQQQNVPGTSSERQNWRHKARYSLEEFTGLPALRELLKAVDRARNNPAVRREPEAGDLSDQGRIRATG